MKIKCKNGSVLTDDSVETHVFKDLLAIISTDSDVEWDIENKTEY
jgi:hypothetical protein